MEEQNNFEFKDLDIDSLTRIEILKILHTVKNLVIKEPDLKTKLEYQNLRVKLFRKMVQLAKEVADQSGSLHSQSFNSCDQTPDLYVSVHNRIDPISFFN